MNEGERMVSAYIIALQSTPQTKLVVQMVSNQYSLIPDKQTDRGYLNVIGLDSAVPSLISDFIGERM